MAFTAKPLVWSMGLIGTCCGVATPLSLSAGANPDYQLKNSGGGSFRDRKGSDLVAESLGRNYDDGQRFSTFESLWQEINREWKGKQVWNGQEQKELTWKTQFQTIVGDSSSVGWQVLKNSWKNCERSTLGSSTYCGYLELRNGNFEYKLKIDHFNNAENKASWRVVAVRRSLSSSSASYWNAYSLSYDVPLWLQENSVSFDKLKSFDQEGAREEWQKIEGISIKQDA